MKTKQRFTDRWRLVSGGVLLLLGSVWLSSTGVAQSRIIYVDAGATGANNGFSWPAAYRFLQDGLATATSGDEIWVAAGTYYPDKGAGQINNDRDATFELISGVGL
jgi:hypothetical protein